MQYILAYFPMDSENTYNKWNQIALHVFPLKRIKDFHEMGTTGS